MPCPISGIRSGMSRTNLKILCCEQGNEISRLVESIYRSVPHDLTSVRTFNDAGRLVRQESVDLLLIDNTRSRKPVDEIQMVEGKNPRCLMILIQESIDTRFDKPVPHHIRLVAESEIAVKLPLILSEVYAELSSAVDDDQIYWSLLREALYEMDAKIMIVDDQARFVFLNRQAESLLALENSEYSGKTVTEYILNATRVWKYLTETCLNQGQTIQNYTIPFVDARSSKWNQIMTIRALTENNGKSYLLLRSCPQRPEDPSHSLIGEYQLLEQFADSISNELLNPVNIISGRLQLLRHELAEQEQFDKGLDTLEKQVNRINETISKLLTFANLKQDYIPQKVQVNEILKQSFGEPSIRRYLENNPIEIEFELIPNLPTLQGLISHFELLFKTIFDLAFQTLGSSGKIIVETDLIKNYLSESFVQISFKLKYVQSIFGSELILSSYLDVEELNRKSKSIETTIITHIVRRYRGTYSIEKADRYREKLTILFPVS